MIEQEDKKQTLASEIQHFEDLTQEVYNTKDAEPAQLKSKLDRLPLLKSVSAFRKTVFICGIAGFCAATDGEWC